MLVVAPDQVLWRVHRSTGAHALPWNAFRHYGPLVTGRFDPHEPPPSMQAAGVIYLGERVQTCVAEVFQGTRRVDPPQGSPYLVALELTRDVELLDLRGTWPTRAGASQAIASGPRPRAQTWARAIRAAFPHVDGVAYPSSMDGGRLAIALFDRARDGLPSDPRGSWPLDHPELILPLQKAADELGYLLV